MRREFYQKRGWCMSPIYCYVFLICFTSVSGEEPLSQISAPVETAPETKQNPAQAANASPKQTSDDPDRQAGLKQMRYWIKLLAKRLKPAVERAAPKLDAAERAELVRELNHLKQSDGLAKTESALNYLKSEDSDNNGIEQQEVKSGKAEETEEPKPKANFGEIGIAGKGRVEYIEPNKDSLMKLPLLAALLSFVGVLAYSFASLSKLFMHGSVSLLKGKAARRADKQLDLHDLEGGLDGTLSSKPYASQAISLPVPRKGE